MFSTLWVLIQCRFCAQHIISCAFAQLKTMTTLVPAGPGSSSVYLTRHSRGIYWADLPFDILSPASLATFLLFSDFIVAPPRSLQESSSYSIFYFIPLNSIPIMWYWFQKGITLDTSFVPCTPLSNCLLRPQRETSGGRLVSFQASESESETWGSVPILHLIFCMALIKLCDISMFIDKMSL